MTLASRAVSNGLPDVAAPERWLRPAQPDPEARARLFLFHHSGASAAAYASWAGYLTSDISAQAVQLPGRQERSSEPPYTQLEPLVGALADVIGPDLDERPYALFGHSMGALLAFRTAVALSVRGWPPPGLLAVSGWAPDGFTPIEPLLEDEHTPPTQLALVAMRGLGDALPPEIEADPDALSAVSRAMVADARVCAGYRDDGAGVPCAIAAYAGRDDPLLEPGAMRSWAARTPRYLGCRTFPGRHYYLREHAASVAAELAQLVRRHVLDP